MATKRWSIIFATAYLVLIEAGFGQSAIHWSVYKTADGLPSEAYNWISFNPHGKLVAGNSNLSLVSELDGYSISNFSAPHGMIGRIRESPGGQRWAMVSSGLSEFKNDTWLFHQVPEIFAQFHSNAMPQGVSIPFFPVRQGSVFFLLPERLMEFSAEEPDHPRTRVIRTTAQTGIGSFTGMAIGPDGGVWICGEHGVAKASPPARNLSPETVWQHYALPGALILNNLSGLEPDSDGGITIVAESTVSHKKIVATFDGNKWTTRPAGSEDFRHAWRGPNGAIWAATSEALFQWNEARTNWIENDDNPVGRIFDVEVELDGAFWLATSDGLIRGSSALWQKAGPDDLDLPVQNIVADWDNRIYFIAGNKLHVLENGLHREFSLPPVQSNPPAASSLFLLKNAPLLVEVGDVPFQFHIEDGSFKPYRSTVGRRVVPLGYLPVGSLCLYAPGTNSYFETFDGGQVSPWNDAPGINDPDAGLTTLFAARNGDLWIGGKHEVLWRHNGKWQEFVSQDRPLPEAVAGFVETPDEKIWCATADGLWQFDGKNWLLLQTKFNHISSLLKSQDGSIWLASNGGLFRFYKDAWLENGEQQGLSGAVHAVCEDARGQIWAATSHGISVFHPEADSGSPKTFVHRLANESSQLSEGGTLNLLLEGREKWKFTPQAQLLYSYQLDQHGWSSFRDITTLSFPNLTGGRHYFQARAIDPAGDTELLPATLDFTVSVPWFRELRLWVTLVLGMGMALFFAAVAWNRHRQLRLSHAAVERKVAERTHELEIATRELIHSQKMNALGTLAAGIAHDFNNILSIVKGSAQIIEDNAGQPEKILTRVARIKTVVQQGAEIVDAMLGFGRGSNALPAPCDVDAVVADTMKLLGDRFLREVEVKFEHTEQLPEISAPRDLIQQILLNFIFNAAEAMTGKKEITMATAIANKLPLDIFLAPAPAASFILVSVKDRGGGIAPEIMPRIFEPFFTTKALSSKRGTGLGLSMVYELAKKMNAGLAVCSVVGQGSTFTLILPVSKQDVASQTVSR